MVIVSIAKGTVLKARIDTLPVLKGSLCTMDVTACVWMTLALDDSENALKG
ncbi:hypothetical protein [Pararobbsia silviterrae]|uniref:hypothetical protein n=1 Tax=Pararobbsia silviterrae TaxID=1792498 RepID=UPI0013147626|nr:hypothetical protein [Pararobbsia silviterrae]